ncbi:MAG: hypothetical protein KF747_01220 [Nitrospira sp.]|nr:hypothetical protein [Nitrospira sp.]
MDINTTKKADHRKDIKLATADSRRLPLAGICRARNPSGIRPKDQWPKGRPSHARITSAPTWKWKSMRHAAARDCRRLHGLPRQSEQVHTCHARHDFNVAESRKPEVRAQCHSGADHNNWEAYSLKHGLKYQRDRDKWNFNIPDQGSHGQGGRDRADLPILPHGVSRQDRPQHRAESTIIPCAGHSGEHQDSPPRSAMTRGS